MNYFRGNIQGSLEFIYPLDYERRRSPNSHANSASGLPNSMLFGQGVYQDISCDSVKKMGILKCTQCPKPDCDYIQMSGSKAKQMREQC